MFHLIWISHINTIFCLIVICIIFISTTFYANIFGHQNYNALGWAFFPIFIYGILNQEWIIASIGLFLSSFGSITVVFCANILSLFMALTLMSINPIIAIIPANIKILFQNFLHILIMNYFTHLNNKLKLSNLEWSARWHYEKCWILAILA